jgi:hypothetical protein
MSYNFEKLRAKNLPMDPIFKLGDIIENNGTIPTYHIGGLHSTSDNWIGKVVCVWRGLSGEIYYRLLTSNGEVSVAQVYLDLHAKLSDIDDEFQFNLVIS